MSALLEIEKNRKALERIEFITALRWAMSGSSQDVNTYLERLARRSEIRLKED